MLFCNQCGTVMKVEKNGVACLDVDENDKPYAIHMGDTFMCRCCKTKVTLANNNSSFQHFNEGFETTLYDFDNAGLLIPPLRGALQ